MRTALFQVCPMLLSVDGPDGAGKSSMVSELTRMISNRFPLLTVTSMRPSCFSVSAASRSIGEEFQKHAGRLEKHSLGHNSYFLEALRTNFQHAVQPALASGEFVILDSSEIRALAFMIDRGFSSAVESTKHRILSGELTSNIQPLTRILLKGTSPVLLSNLSTKDCLDGGDPRDLKEVERRVAAYGRAVDLVKSLSCNIPAKWISIEIEHVVSPVSRYVSDLIENKIYPFLDFLDEH